LQTWFILSSILSWIVILLNLVLTLALVRKVTFGSNIQQGGLKRGQPAPDFQVQDLDGTNITLADYKHHKTVFVFISTQCGPCKQALPTLEKLGPQARQANENLVLVSRNSYEETSHLSKEMDLHLTVLLAPPDESSFFQDYNVTGTPSYCFIDEQGKVQSSGILNPKGLDWKAITNNWTAQSSGRKEVLEESRIS